MKQKSTDSSATGSAASSSQSKSEPPLPAYPFYVICVRAYEPSLYVGRTYKVVKPRARDRAYDFRVIDEEREDYIYPRDWFVPIDLPTQHKRRVSRALAAVSQT